MAKPQPRSPIDLSLDLSQTKGFPLLPDSDELQEIWQTTIGWQPNEQQRQLFQQLYHAILQGNRVFNLTRITEPREFWEKHLWDSMSGLRAFLNADALDDGEDVEKTSGKPADTSDASSRNPQPSDTSDTVDTPQPFIKQSLKVIDIGTGGGFPGIPVAIACPHWHITLLDSTRKKTLFLDAALNALHLDNARTLTDRAEAVGRSTVHREHYDIALLRAVAPVSVCVEYALPLLAVGGWAVLYRGHWTDEETEALFEALDLLGGELVWVDELQTPLTGGDRHCILLNKVAETPRDFPRAIGVPAKDPL